MNRNEETITVLKADYEQLVRDAVDLAEDVICYVGNEYSLRDKYPTYQRKYDRDTDVARKVLEKYNEEGE